ncbi:hypothetical protein ScalyP_jg10530 [Parmales sp. scaly parma]|nr:hypothetical protein ScalyP_jg10530 [Parmales sp. scaly parma]
MRFLQLLFLTFSFSSAFHRHWFIHTTNSISSGLYSTSPPITPPRSPKRIPAYLTERRKPQRKLPKIAIVGRPNVGKSALVNRLCGKRGAIVADEIGVTRDRTSQFGMFVNKRYCCVDTGGLVFDDAEGVFVRQIREQAMIAIDEAEAVIMVVDGREGINAMDSNIAEFLRKEVKIPCFVAVNKCESEKTGLAQAAEFYSLGLGEPFAVSALHGVGTAELLEAVFEDPVFKLDEEEAFDETSESEGEKGAFKPPTGTPQKEEISVAIVGKPNSGKSSLLNALTHSNRAIVSAVAGTTRDAIDEVVSGDVCDYRFVDCAGVRKKSKVNSGVEFYMVNRVLRAIRRSDVVLLVIDATIGVTEQDRVLAQLISDQGKAVVVVCNKFDLVEKTDDTYDKSVQYVRDELNMIRYAPVLFISATTGKRVNNIYELVDKAVESSAKRYPTSVLNEVLRDAIFFKNVPAKKNGKMGKIYYAQQVSTNPPNIVVFCNDHTLVNDGYKRYLDRKVRESLPGYNGTPIKWMFRSRRERDVERKGNGAPGQSTGSNYPYPQSGKT